MRILSLDTTSAAGSVALVRDGEIVAERAGDASRTHGERLPRELMAVLEDAREDLNAIDRFAVVNGPGSFTGLRVGMATIQGLALAQGRLVTPISTFAAIAGAAARARSGGDDSAATAIWIDAHRGEVFATLLAADGVTVLQAPTSLGPDATLDAWAAALPDAGPIRFEGDGAIRYRDRIEARLGTRADIASQVPLLAGAAGRIAARSPDHAVQPHALVPIYVRRSDAELARDRARPPGA